MVIGCPLCTGGQAHWISTSDDPVVAAIGLVGTAGIEVEACRRVRRKESRDGEDPE